MVTLSERITLLRSEKALSARALSQTLGFGPQAIEKFEAGKLTPTKVQLQKLADHFGVTVAYVKGETDDRTRMDSFLDWDVPDEPVSPPPRPAEKPAAEESNRGGVAAAFINTPAFQQQLRDMVRAELKSEASRDIIRRMIKEELAKLK